ncbi:rRNA maturation RNase YbeY [Sunxiuqinia sp. A32]|uniref:rRNA maturation RNase YbeY n=1 Tax=Sunxiuqinia sp. A32 TaxID=3461496 RepID=UPI0040465C9C
MSINYYFEEIEDLNLSEKLTTWINRTILSEEKKAGEISFIFCSDDYLLQINKEHLQHDYYTDVITFDYVEGDVVSGDIFISVDRIRENASDFNVSFDTELNRIMIHGVLHLLGFKDKSKDEKLEMTAKEDEYLALL